MADKVIHQGKYLNFLETESGYEYVERVGNQSSVSIIAMTDHGQMVLVLHPCRPPVKKPTLEFPAGMIDAGETPIDAALRELQEETGFKSYVHSVVSVIGPTYSSPGMSTETNYLVRVRVSGKPGKQVLQEGEQGLKVVYHSPAELLKLASSYSLSSRLAAFISAPDFNKTS